jgi:hypothetical protein
LDIKGGGNGGGDGVNNDNATEIQKGSDEADGGREESEVELVRSSRLN